MKRHARAHLGFTLLELIVVIAIFGVFSLMAYGGLNSVLKTRRQVELSLERTAQFQKTYQRLRDDLQQVRNRPARDSYGDAQPPLRGDRDTHVEFTRGGWRNPLQLPRPGMERVNYLLSDKRLTRTSWRVLDQAQDSKPVSVTLLEPVEELHFRYLSNGHEWSDTWPPLNATGQVVGASGSSAPAAVEITLVTKDWGNLKFLFRLGMDALPGNFTQGLASGTAATPTPVPSASPTPPAATASPTPAPAPSTAPVPTP